jgi:uncharacterized protein (TIGR03000 family)
MFRKHLILPVALSLACLLLSVPTARAQSSYFFGYYYPSEHRFHTDALEFDNLDFYGPNDTAFLDAFAPAASQVRVVPPAAAPATVRVILPDAQAHVWFENHATTTTGTDRLYQSGPLASGNSYQYHVRVSFMQAGREVREEQTVIVNPGQTTVVDFTRPITATVR